MGRTTYSIVKNHVFPDYWYVMDNWLSVHRDRRLLEVGCSHGLFTDAFVKSGWQVTCTANNDETIKRTKSRLQDNKKDVKFSRIDKSEALPFPQDSFPIVVCLHTLESDPYPQQMLDEIRTVLMPGGSAIIAVSQSYTPWVLSSVQSSLNLDTEKGPTKGFSFRGIVNLLNQSYFDVRSIKSLCSYTPWQTPFGKLPFPREGNLLIHAIKTH